VARLFPSLERNLREITDYGIGFNQDGSIRFRAESNKQVAIDGQTGIILRTWREHLISADADFLTRVWPSARKALAWLVEFKRNPYNEIECSDHYARAGASYSAFLAVCGYTYDGTAARIGFAPKLSPGNFKAAFTASEGWGSYSQKFKDGKWSAEIELVHGLLRMHKLELPWLGRGGVRVTQNNRSVKNTRQAGSIVVDEPLRLHAGDVLRVTQA